MSSGYCLVAQNVRHTGRADIRHSNGEKHILLASVLALGIATGVQTAAQAQLNLGAVQSTKDPLTGLSAVDWIKLATNLVDGSAVIGQPMIFMLNGTGKELSAVTCDGTYQLVGPKPYIKGAPSRLKPWRATLVPTKGFDGYCKKSITAQSDDGVTYESKLVSSETAPHSRGLYGLAVLAEGGRSTRL
jgi:hypothetical protein